MIDAMPLFLEVRVCIGTRLKLMNIRTNEARTYNRVKAKQQILLHRMSSLPSQNRG